MASLNQVQLIGYVGDEPKIIATRSGKSMATISLGTTERGFKRADGTDVPERTEWHNITMFGNNASFVQRYVHKGSQIFVQGSLHTRKFDKQDGTKGYTTEITADIVQLLDRKPQSTSGQTFPQPEQPQYPGMPDGNYNNPAPDDPDLPF